MEVIMSSTVQNCSGMENGRGDGLRRYQERKQRKLLKRKNTEIPDGKQEIAQPREYQLRRKRKLLKREDTENPGSKLEIACQNADMITQSSIQDNPNTNPGTSATGELSKRQRRRNIKLLEREDIENPESKLEVAHQNADMITQSSIQDNPNTNLGTSATGELSKRQKRRNRKLLKLEDTENPESKLQVACQNVDMITQSSIQDNPNTDLGTTAPGELSRSQRRRNRKLLKREDTENPESKLEVARQNVDMITQSSIQDNPNTDLGTTAPGQLSRSQRRRNRKLLKREDTENPESKLEVAHQNVDMITQSSIQDNPNTDLGTTAPGELSKRQIGRDRELLKREDTKNPESKLEVARQNADMITQSSIQDNPNTDLGTTATGELSKRQIRRNRKLLKLEDTENPESKLEVPRQNVEMITLSSVQDNPNTDLGTTATVELSKRQERRNRKLLKREDTENPECKLEVPRRNADIITVSESSISKREGFMEIAKVEKGSSRTTSVDVKSGSKREEYMEIANDMKGSSRNATLDVKPSSRCEEQMEVGNGETPYSSAIGAHDAKNTMLKGEKSMNIVISETVSSGTAIIDTGSKREEYMGTSSGEAGSGKITTLDATMVSKGEEHTKVANDEMGSNMPKNVHVEGTTEKKKKKKSRKKKPTLGEILNPQQLEDMEVAIGETDSGTTATDNAVSKKRKRQKLENKNPAAGDILGTRVCIQDMELAKKGLSSTEVLEPASGESVSCKTATPDAKIVSKGNEHTEVANGKMGSSKTKNLDVNGTVQKTNEQKSKKRRPTLGEILNPQYLQNLEAATTNSKKSAKNKRLKTVSKREEHTGSSGTTTIDAKPVSKVEECTSIGRKTEKLIKKKEDVDLKAINVIPHFPTPGKKLIVLDVNGLLADIVFPPPKDAKADKCIPRRAIFKRPFLDDFLCFCFERFHVAIWSSRTKQVLDPVVDCLLGDLKNKLLFLWNASSCTNSGTGTLENRHKPMVFKDLRKIWEKNGPGNSWVKGTYNESNTLLLDDSPYKALLNPKHSGIFPVSYSYKNTNDDFLGPTGAIRTYLEGVAATDNLKLYVEQHPFGQGFIDEKNPHWNFYSRVLKSKKTNPRQIPIRGFGCSGIGRREQVLR